MNRSTLGLISFILLVGCKQEVKQNVTFQKTGDMVIDALSEKIQDSPMVADNYYQRAQALYEKEEYSRVIQDMEDALKIDSLNPNYYHLLADGYMDYYRSKEALATMRKVLKIYPTRVASLLKLAEMEYIVKRHDVSIYQCNLVLKEKPQNAEALFMLGLNFRAQGLIKEAISSFQTATEFDPDLIDAWIILGDLYAESGDKKAIEYYNSAIMLAPDRPETKHSKAYFLQNNGDVKGALDLYREIIISEPSYGMAYLNSGILYMQQDDLDKAYENFNILAQREPTNANAFFYRAQVSYLKGEYGKSIDDLKNTLTLNPNDKEAKSLLQEIENIK